MKEKPLHEIKLIGNILLKLQTKNIGKINTLEKQLHFLPGMAGTSTYATGLCLKFISLHKERQMKSNRGDLIVAQTALRTLE